MKKAKEISLIIAALAFVAGLIICVAVFVSVKFDLNALAIWKTETKEYAISETFSGVVVDSASHDINVMRSEDSTCKVVCDETENLTYKVGVEDGLLKIALDDNREWYQYMDLVFTPRKVTVYLPDEKYDTLDISVSSGNVTIGANLIFTDPTVSTTSGNVDINTGCSGAKIRTTSGNIEYNGNADETELETDSGNITVAADTNGDFSMTTGSGNIKVDRSGFNSLDIVYGSGNVNISAVTISYGFTASGKSGDLKFTDFDASYMDVSTTSGNVTGSLRTGKQFDVVSERGDVEIPESEDGGKCRIRTSTGDIKVSIKPNPLYQSE